MLSAQAPLEFPDSSRIRFIGADEANHLAEEVRKRNVFARHSWENNFYVERARGLADQTVIEVSYPGDPKSMRDKAEETALQVERIAVLSSALAIKKQDLLRKMGISHMRRTEVDFIFSADFRFISSTSIITPKIQGLLIDDTFSKRFSQCGFYGLGSYLHSNSDLSSRVSLSIQWLFDSRVEPRIQSAAVKSAISLESLLIFSETESLAQSLSERAAFILSANPARRQLISRILKRFYEVRSGVVHGSQKNAKKLTQNLLETVDRIAVLLNLAISANSKIWSDVDSLRVWCESQRWGEPSKEINIPFPDKYLRNLLAVGKNEFD
jgi:hypothetical protein